MLLKQLLLFVGMLLGITTTLSANDTPDPRTGMQETVLTFLAVLDQVETSKSTWITPEIMCPFAKGICKTADCCSYFQKYKDKYHFTTCDQVCQKLDSICNNHCPAKYKYWCDLGCKYKTHCATLCPCLKSHCGFWRVGVKLKCLLVRKQLSRHKFWTFCVRSSCKRGWTC